MGGTKNTNGFSVVEIGETAIDARLLMQSRWASRCATQCQAGACCSWGVVLTGTEANRILAERKALQDILQTTVEPWRWFEYYAEGDDHRPGADREVPLATTAKPDATKAVGQSCIFLLPEGCALQVLALQRGEHPWKFKPDYCWLWPLTYQHGVVTMSPDSVDFCLAPSATPHRPLYDVQQELTYRVGARGWARLVELAEGEYRDAYCDI